ETTGAGDNFAVGFLTSWHRLKHLEKAVRAGNLFGSESTRYAGGVQAQDNFKALMIDYPDLF
ncbi:MAG: PfkB family carbohydrate kinase, partial [Bacteroidetes bacterium]|nr:PfkB family carbohydrate kinase [Bacteroidota bacterium]